MALPTEEEMEDFSENCGEEIKYRPILHINIVGLRSFWTEDIRNVSWIRENKLPFFIYYVLFTFGTYVQ